MGEGTGLHSPPTASPGTCTAPLLPSHAALTPSPSPWAIWDPLPAEPSNPGGGPAQTQSVPPPAGKYALSIPAADWDPGDVEDDWAPCEAEGQSIHISFLEVLLVLKEKVGETRVVEGQHGKTCGRPRGRKVLRVQARGDQLRGRWADVRLGEKLC